MGCNRIAELSFRLIEKRMVPVEMKVTDEGIVQRYKERFLWSAVVDVVTDSQTPPDYYIAQEGESL